jgi:hypothetical protein
VPLSLLKGWIHVLASVNPATTFLEAGRGPISGVHDHTLFALARARGLVAVSGFWTLTGLRDAERSALREQRPAVGGGWPGSRPRATPGRAE